MNENIRYGKKQKELEAKYKAYWQNNSLNGWILLLLAVFILEVIYIMLRIIFDFHRLDINFFLLIVVIFGLFMLIIYGKIALKTRNNHAIIQFIIGSGVVLWGVTNIYLFAVDKPMEILVLFVLLFAFLMIMFYVGKKKFKRNIFGKDTALYEYRNVVIKEAEQIDLLTDGYSKRPFSKEYKQIKTIKNFKNKAREFAKFLGKEGVIMDWDTDENSIILFPPIFMDNFLMSASYAISLIFGKNKLSWVKISEIGRVSIFISDEDYKRTTKEVAYHLLCRNLAEKFEQSFIEFAKGNKDNSIKILRGDENE